MSCMYVCVCVEGCVAWARCLCVCAFAGTQGLEHVGVNLRAAFETLHIITAQGQVFKGVSALIKLLAAVDAEIAVQLSSVRRARAHDLSVLELDTRTLAKPRAWTTLSSHLHARMLFRPDVPYLRFCVVFADVCPHPCL